MSSGSMDSNEDGVRVKVHPRIIKCIPNASWRLCTPITVSLSTTVVFRNASSWLMKSCPLYPNIFYKTHAYVQLTTITYPKPASNTGIDAIAGTQWYPSVSSTRANSPPSFSLVTTVA